MLALLGLLSASAVAAAPPAVVTREPSGKVFVQFAEELAEAGAPDRAALEQRCLTPHVEFACQYYAEPGDARPRWLLAGREWVSLELDGKLERLTYTRSIAAVATAGARRRAILKLPRGSLDGVRVPPSGRYAALPEPARSRLWELARQAGGPASPR